MEHWMTDWRRIIKAAEYSFKGFKAVWVGEAAFRQLIVMLAIMLPSGLLMAGPLFLKLFLLFSAALILIVELFNSAIEAVVDRIGKEIHPLSGRAKDMGSAAQFISSTVFVLLWLFVCYTYFHGAV